MPTDHLRGNASSLVFALKGPLLSGLRRLQVALLVNSLQAPSIQTLQ